MTKRTNTKAHGNSNNNNNKRLVTQPCPEPADALQAMLDAWEGTRARREAIPVETVRALSLDLTTSVIVMQGTYERMLPLRGRIVGEFASFDARNFDELPLYCAAAVYGNARARAETEAAPAVSMSEVAGGADKQYAKMMRAYLSAADAGLVSVEALEKIREGAGWRNRAESLRALVAVGLARWEEIKKVSILRDEDLVLATSLADQILGYFARKSQSKVASEAQVERRRALMLAVNAYEELRRAVQWLRWHEGDADELAPTVFGVSMKRTPKRAEVSEDEKGGGEEKKEGEGEGEKPGA